MPEVSEISGWPQSDAILRWPTSRSKAWTERFLDSARRDKNILAVIAVGSAIRPNVPSADLDLVVICGVPAKLTTKPPLEVDLRTYAADEVDTLIESGNDLIGWAVKYGRAIYQKDYYWDEVLKSWRHRLPFPSADLARRRANDAFRRFKNMLDLGDYEAAYEQALSYATHLAREALLRNKRYPTSRPELPTELRAVGCISLADCLDRLISRKYASAKQLTKLLSSMPPNGSGASIESKRVNRKRP